MELNFSQSDIVYYETPLKVMDTCELGDDTIKRICGRLNIYRQNNWFADQCQPERRRQRLARRCAALFSIALVSSVVNNLEKYISHAGQICGYRDIKKENRTVREEKNDSKRTL